MKVYLKYTFIFDTDGAWQRKDDFENDLFSYFLGNGLEAQVCVGATEDEEEKIVFLNKMNPIEQTPVSPVPKNPVFTKAIKTLNGKSMVNSGSK